MEHFELPNSGVKFFPWTLGLVLRFEEVHQYLELELRLQTAWVRMR